MEATWPKPRLGCGLLGFCCSTELFEEVCGIVFFIVVCLPCVASIWSYIAACAVLSRVQLFVTPWTVAHQAPLSMGFSRQDYWSELPCPPPGDRPDPGIKPGSLALQWGSLPLYRLGNPVCSLFRVKNRLMTMRGRASVCVTRGDWEKNE